MLMRDEYEHDGSVSIESPVESSERHFGNLWCQVGWSQEITVQYRTIIDYTVASLNAKK